MYYAAYYTMQQKNVIIKSVYQEYPSPHVCL